MATAHNHQRCTVAQNSVRLVTLLTFGPKETHALGQWIGARLSDDAVVGLDGTLGTGKTCFVQGLARGLGVRADTHVTSPAYNLIQTYTIGRQKLTHIDFYRLSSLSVDDFMLFEEAFSGPRNIVVAEWASGFIENFAQEFLHVTISKEPEENTRRIEVSSSSSTYAKLLNKLSDYANIDN
ncbi:MAG: tRNA (adenosine(37)-N6)-threonylcarbamoyltransferase complex ATPase subunit type 1 TsaE [Bacteroidota bacterium]|nr:tRNA (adenosine(37)-N6)-threonylcarbamoyltransferase complex ATPase subunit type 1 TsaE [Bacteroidota bacterium]